MTNIQAADFVVRALYTHINKAMALQTDVAKQPPKRGIRALVLYKNTVVL